LIWSGKEAEARRELEVAEKTDPYDATALKLLGDLSSWRGDWDNATAYYTRAQWSAPGMPGLSEVLATAQDNREKARLAALAWNQPRSTSVADATIGVDAFSDNLGFRWATTSASRAFVAGGTAIRAVALSRVFQGTPTGVVTRNPGVGFRVEASREVLRGLEADAMAGAEQYSMIGSTPTYGFGLTATDLAGMRLTVEAHHENAARSASTIAALQARAVSDVVAITGSRSFRAWSIWAHGEEESITSIVGGVRRVAASATVTRTIGPRLAAFASVAGLSANRASPVMQEFGPVLWAPKYYAEPAAGVTYRVTSYGGFTVNAVGQGGYAFARERANDQRFPAGSRPTATVGADISYLRGRWDAALTARYGGALSEGYRSGTLGIRASYRIGK
jgi:hypothetical protein